MTTQLAERRKKWSLQFGAIAAGLVAIAAVVVAIDVRSAQPNTTQGLVNPGLVQQLSRAQRVIVTSPDGSYRIERTQRGWAMRDRGDYPVSSARLNQLTQGLSTLQFTRRMTSDPTHYQRLGVTDPRQRGSGVLVQIEDGQGALLVNLILGVQPQGLYVRRPDDAQVWAARGQLPALRDAAVWLDLHPLMLNAAQISRVEVTPQTGSAYILERQSRETNDFAIVSPARQVGAAGAATGTATRITQLNPVDVQTAPSIQGPARGRVRVTTFDGIAVDGELVDFEGRTWLKLTAAPQRPEAEAAALAINQASGGWAFALSPEDLNALTPPLSALLPAPPTPAAPATTSAP